MKNYLKILAEKCEFYDISPKFLWSLIELESAWNQWAVRYEPGYNWICRSPRLDVYISQSTLKYSQKCSYGLCQVMGNHYYEQGGKGYCTELLDAELNMKVACEIIKRHKDKYGRNPLDVYAAYNAGTVRMYDGVYSNAKIVKKFEEIFRSDFYELATASLKMPYITGWYIPEGETVKLENKAITKLANYGIIT